MKGVLSILYNSSHLPLLVLYDPNCDQPRMLMSFNFINFREYILQTPEMSKTLIDHLSEYQTLIFTHLSKLDFAY